jgi:DNA-binding beta-propeller fold protein YncE
LDVVAEDTVQIWRYEPQGDAYPNRPERYFAAPLSTGSKLILDMAIDGYIYILYDDGTVEKFLGGEPQQFEIRDVPGGLGQVTAFAVDPDGSGTVYVADPGNRRVVELGPGGNFKAQLRSGEAFAALEALAVNEAQGQLYVLEGGRLHVASLP